MQWSDKYWEIHCGILWYTVVYCGILCRYWDEIYSVELHTGDAIRAMYSSVRVNVVHVLCGCAQVQSTVWCSCHTAACNHRATNLFVAFLCVFFFFFLFLFFLFLFFLLLFLFLFLLFFFFFFFFLLLQHSLCRIFVDLKLSNSGLFAFCWHFRSKKRCKYQGFWRLWSPKPRVFFTSGSKNHGIYSVFPPEPWYLRSFQHVARCSFFMRKGQKHCLVQNRFPRTAYNFSIFIPASAHSFFQLLLPPPYDLLLERFRNSESPPNFVPERWQNEPTKMPKDLALLLKPFEKIPFSTWSWDMPLKRLRHGKNAVHRTFPSFFFHLLVICLRDRLMFRLWNACEMAKILCIDL